MARLTDNDVGPTTTDQDQAWGTDIRQLTSGFPGLQSTSTVTFSTDTGGSGYPIVVDPYTAKAAAASPGTESDSPNLGWALNELAASADSTDSLAADKFVIPAGTWTIHCEVSASAPALLDSYAFDLVARIYRVGPGAGFTRTLLASCNLPTAQAVSAAGDFSLDLTNGASIGRIVLAADETLLVSFTFYSFATTALVLGAVTNSVLTFHTGLRGNNVRITFPAAPAHQYAQAISARLDGVAEILRKNRRTISARMDGVPSMLRKVGKPILARLAGVVSIVRKTGHIMPTARAAGVASVNKKVGHIMPTARMDGVPSITRKVGHIMPTARMAGVATLLRDITAHRLLEARLAGVALLDRRITARRTLSARAAGVASITRKTGKKVDARMAGVPSLARRITAFRLLAARLAGIASLARKNPRTLSARMAGVASRTQRIIAARTLSAKMIGRAKGLVKISFEILSRITGGGGTTVVKKVINYIFDD